MQLDSEQRQRLMDLHKRVAWRLFAVFEGLGSIEGWSGGGKRYELVIAPAKFRELSGGDARPYAVSITIPWEVVLACKTDQEYVDLLETEIAIARVKG